MSKSGDAFMKFVGMCECDIVAHSKSFDEVYDATVKACGSKYVPFVIQVLSAECMLP